MNMTNKQLKLIGAILFIVLLFMGLWLVMKSPQDAKNPYDDPLLSTSEGIDTAVLYNYDELFIYIGENEDVLNTIRDDIFTFARNTISSLTDPESKVAFTFQEGNTETSDAKIFTGLFYGSSDEIQLTVTPHGRGVYTLSILNLTNATNIDESLSLNGARNEFIQSLPIQNSKYSIRYLISQDKIVVTFYEGYTVGDINAVEQILKTALGATYESDVIFSINTVGIFTLSEIRNKLQ